MTQQKILAASLYFLGRFAPEMRLSDTDKAEEAAAEVEDTAARGAGNGPTAAAEVEDAAARGSGDGPTSKWPFTKEAISLAPTACRVPRAASHVLCRPHI